MKYDFIWCDNKVYDHFFVLSPSLNVQALFEAKWRVTTLIIFCTFGVIELEGGGSGDVNPGDVHFLVVNFFIRGFRKNSTILILLMPFHEECRIWLKNLKICGPVLHLSNN